MRRDARVRRTKEKAMRSRARREFDAWTNDLLVSGTNRTRQCRHSSFRRTEALSTQFFSLLCKPRSLYTATAAVQLRY